MSREHFQESQIEDRVTQLMEEGMSDEDAIQKAESEYHGQVNLVEDQALKIHLTNKVSNLENEITLLKQTKVIDDGKIRCISDDREWLRTKTEEYRKALRQGVYPSEIVLSKVVDHLQANYNSSSQIRSTKFFCRDLLTEINDWTLEVANAE